jgi:hypothetical protein
MRSWRHCRDPHRGRSPDRASGRRSEAMHAMNRCPVCGYNGLDEPAYDSFGCASFEICPSCGTEFGYDDATRSHESLCDEWIAKGMPWWADDKPPPGWDPRAAVAFADERPGPRTRGGVRLRSRRHGRATKVALDAAARSMRSTSSTGRRSSP